MSKRREKSIVSYNMSRIKSNGTKIERVMTSALRRNKIKYRRQLSLFGKPDFTLLAFQVVIFCDSAFWHGYRNMRTKRHSFKSNKCFWEKKILRNIERDKEVNKILKREGFSVLRFWDFQIERDIERCVRKIKETIKIEK